MPTEKELVLNAIRKQKELKDLREQYNKAREELKEHMIEKEKDTIETGWYLISLKKKPIINENKMRNEYPEIFFEGLECNFRKRKANKMYDPILVDRVVDECKEGDDFYVQIQTNPKNRKTKKT